VDTAYSFSETSVFAVDIKLAHKLRDLDRCPFNDFFTKAMLTGAENRSLFFDIVQKAKFAMTLPPVEIN
jgi:hypothetical protein